MTGISLQGPLAGAVLLLLGLYLLLAPIERLARKRSPYTREFERSRLQLPVPIWMKVFFRALGAVLLVVAGLLLAPALGGG